MTQEEHIKYWLDSADHDLDTANTLFSSGKNMTGVYLFVISS